MKGNEKNGPYETFHFRLKVFNYFIMYFLHIFMMSHKKSNKTQNNILYRKNHKNKIENTSVLTAYTHFGYIIFFFPFIFSTHQTTTGRLFCIVSKS